MRICFTLRPTKVNTSSTSSPVSEGLAGGCTRCLKGAKAWAFFYPPLRRLRTHPEEAAGRTKTIAFLVGAAHQREVYLRAFAQ